MFLLLDPPEYIEPEAQIDPAECLVSELSEEAQNKNLYKLTDEEDTQLQDGIEEILRMIRVMSAIGN